MNQIRILLITAVLEDAIFIREALEETQELAPAGQWTAISVMHIEDLESAGAVVRAGCADVIFLDPFSAGAQPLEAFGVIYRAAPEIPLVLLLDRSNESLASALLRAGAQDCLIKQELDCGPLARAIRNAIERQRLLNATRSVSAFDELTGLYNERGFHLTAEREMYLGKIAAQPVVLILARLDHLTALSREQREIATLAAADVLRAAGGDTVLLARCGERFAALLWADTPDRFIFRVQNQLDQRLNPFNFVFGWASAAAGAQSTLPALLADAEACLCENGQSYPFQEASHSTPPIPSAPAFPA
jgi:DNA-binding NarL/FixJ family response regulator